jgi:hypothetical protein
MLGLIGHDTWLAVAAAALGGACLGFLPRNLARPARIFLGDGGSMPLGFTVAVLAMSAAARAHAPWQSVVVGLLLVGIPALDTCLVVVSRRRRGVSVLTGGRDHLTHRVGRYLPGTRAVALSLGAVQAAACGLAVLAAQGGSAFVVFSAILYLAAAGCAIGVLESRPAEELAIVEAPQAAGPGRAISDWVALAGLVIVGLGAGLSPFFGEYYASTTWVPIGLGLVVFATTALVARPRRITGPAALAVGGLLGLAMWSLSSAAWAQSVENAVVSGNRMLVYGALLVVVLTLLRGERRSTWLIGALLVGVVAVGLSVLARRLGAAPGSLFLGGRLNAPLGYINGEGCLFVMGFWLCWAAAEWGRPAVAGAGAGAATLMACLALLSESRGTALAMAVSLAAVVLVVPGRRRRLVGLAVVGAAVAAARSPLLAVYQHGDVLPVGVAHAAGRAAALAAAGAGAVWGAAVAAHRRVVAGNPALAGRLRTGVTAALAALALVGVIAAVASAGRIAGDASSQWHVFTHLSEPADSGVGSSSTAGQSRLLSGAGNRYDYWRIALRVWQGNPLVGIGAGNYDRPYFAERSTTEDILQPHSLELQTLSELGLVGAALLATLIAGLALGARRMRRAASGSTLTRSLLIAALGTTVGWFTQTSVDWMHLLPGVTAIALGAMGVLVAARGGPDPATPAAKPGRSPTTRRTAAVLGITGVAVTLVMAGASLSRQGLAEVFRGQAQADLETNPAAALREADKSLGFDSDAVSTYYIKAAALAHFDDAAAAEGVLRAALRHEPDSFVTWALLGDIAVREGRMGVAKRDYSRAHALNPREPSLRALAADPRAALR